MSDIGGYWSALSALSFVLLTMFMYDSMLKDQAKIIMERRETTLANMDPEEAE